MSAIDRQVSRARRRLTSNILLERAALSVVIAAAAWSLALVVERLFALDLRLLPGVGAAAVLAAAITLVGTHLARVSSLRAAVALDEAAGLKERVSTALTCRRDPDPFAHAAVHDAERVAGGVHLPAHLPLRAPALWPWSIATVLGAVILYAFLPVFDLLADDDGPQQPRATAVEREQVTAVLDNQLKKIERLAERNPQLRELAQNLQPLALPAEPSATPDDIRREAVKKIDNLAEKLTREKEARQLDSLKQLRRMLARLERQPGDDAVSKLSQALSQGDMESARQALAELKKKLEQAARSGDPPARRQVARLQKKLADVSKQLAKLGDTTRLQKELQRKTGLSKEEAQKLLKQLAKMDPKQMQKELQRRLADSGLSREQIKQLAKKLADRKAAMKKCRGLGKSLAQAAAAMQQSDSPNGAAAAAAGMAALDGALGQLSDLETAQQLLDEIEAELADLGNCRAGVCQGNYAPRAGPPSANVGLQGPNQGLGYGSRIGKERRAHGYQPTKVKSRNRGGEIIGQVLIDAPQLKGEAAAEVRDAVNSAVRDATDAVERNAIPRQYEHVLKVYFERLAGLVNAKPETVEPKAPKAGE